VSIVNSPRRWAAAAVLTVLTAGCGSTPAPLTRSPTTTPPPATTTTPATATATPSATAPSGHQKVTVTPATGLKSGQKTLVQASGFSPGESLVVTECAAKGAATGPGDCALDGMQSVTSDASGQVKVDLTVTKGPFGANNIVCGPAQACLISVTQATPSPTQEADTPITFGLPGHACRDGDQPGHDRDLCRAARRTGTRMRAADLACKLKNPVSLGFLDFSTVAARTVACARETELNLRFAPAMYLGVAEFRGPDGQVCDHLVVMRRMPASRRLSTLVRSHAPVAVPLRQVARILAAQHAKAVRSPADRRTRQPGRAAPPLDGQHRADPDDTRAPGAARAARPSRHL